MIVIWICLFLGAIFLSWNEGYSLGKRHERDRIKQNPQRMFEEEDPYYD